jgi:hypothetical protein
MIADKDSDSDTVPTRALKGGGERSRDISGMVRICFYNYHF